MSKPIVDSEQIDEKNVKTENLVVSVRVSNPDEKGERGVILMVRNLKVDYNARPLFVLEMDSAMSRALAQALDEVSERADQLKI